MFSPLFYCGSAESSVTLCERSAGARRLSENVGDTEMSVIRQTVQVLTGHRLLIMAPELMDGDWVHVVVSSTSETAQSATRLPEFIDALPPGSRAASDWNEY